ncbi:type ISP restriction/modification enzyme [Phenylobacterium kunshanense]|uniref:site-specific DNA-methyltransferase (adenine-specific) n=1 Tax=Phenylobacterium kunshanense TaxID=1445034 RepID=A0A328B918_9CAUL|nr:type ISP restriction/modification enzyme [Phenylobacterium kunshanense]RAK63319.1 hypothetical protein DJ019_16445 [Phenylobacterium kunshanense]
MTSVDSLKAINDFPSLVAYLRDELEWEIPEDLGFDQLTYSYTAAELGLKLEAQVEITQLRPILGQQNPWGVFFVDFDKAELPVTLLRRILSSVSRRKRESANPGDRALFDKNDLLFVSAFGKADDRRLALAHFHQEPNSAALPTLRVLAWDRQDTPRHMATVAERLERLRWPDGRQLEEAWKARWAGAFIDRPRDGIRTAKEMAEALAECAKQIRQAIQEILPKERPGQPLGQLFEAVKATLNKDLDVPKFADTYAQTIAYGLLSKRIDQVQRWRAEKARTLNGALPLPSITVEALETAIPTNPFLSELLNSFLAAGGRDRAGAGLDFDELGLGDVIDLLNTANMEAVLDDFDKDKQGDDPVIHFYEGFLAAYDKAMKVQRGVFYTPRPVVSFIVRSVDELLRTEFGLPLGLADTTTWGQFVAARPGTKVPEGAKAEDPFVKILDPATGTGTFLVEVIDLIHRRMMDDAWKAETAAEKRRLWNVYVAERLLPRLYGYELMMAPYAVAHMKIGLKLADTGYDFSGTETGPSGRARPARARVFLTNALEPAQDLDMQLAFMSEALAQEATAANDAKSEAQFTVIVGNPPYSNFGKSNDNPWISRLLAGFRGDMRGEVKVNLYDDYIKFFAMANNAVERAGAGVIGFITNRSYLDGSTQREMRHAMLDGASISVLDLYRGIYDPEARRDENVFDITTGVAISLIWKPVSDRQVLFSRLVGKYSEKVEILSKEAINISGHKAISPSSPQFLLIDAPAENEAYESWIALPDLFVESTTGVQTNRDELCLSSDSDELFSRLTKFASSTDEAWSLCARLGVSKSDFWSPQASSVALKQKGVSRARIKPYIYRIFEPCFIYYDEDIVHRPRELVARAVVDRENISLLASRGVDAPRLGIGFVAGQAADKRVLKSARGEAKLFPARVPSVVSDANFRGESLGFGEIPSEDGIAYVYAVISSATYMSRFEAELRLDYPRIPKPKSRELFRRLISLGARLVALHMLDANALPDLFVSPKVRFVSNGGEPRLGRINKEVRRDASGRVYLNDQNWFATVPQAAWEHWIGGYQPAQKWLKDRSESGSKDKLKPGRLLTEEDILHYRRMIVALEETGKVMAEIDEVIARHGGWPDAFKGMSD